MTLLVQKEVADRVVARDGKESILSMSVKAYGTPIYVSKVLAGSFVPAPNVDSAILCIKDISKKFFIDNSITEEKFFAVMKAGFAHKRKMLVGNLREAGFVVPASYGAGTSKLGGLEDAPQHKPLHKQKARAEDLALDDWIEVVKVN
jgi:16S rRNA (adenine1518-N6/adenine1519-N6)-dimethyltransferase